MTQGPGRSPATAPALSSLGAVGGARGTAAGAIRILVEFLTQYDSTAVKQLEADLRQLGTEEQNIGKQQLATARALDTARKRERDATKEIQRLISTNAAKPSAVRGELREIDRIGVLTREGKLRLSVLSRELTGNDQLAKLVERQAKSRRAAVGFQTRLTNQSKTELGIAEQRTAVEGRLSKFQQLKSNLAPKLGGLALGALGGIVGGAVLGIGFTAAQAGLEAVGEGIQNLLDPARKAREAVSDLASTINDLAKETGGDRLAASRKFLEDIGVDADEQTVALLARAAALGEVKDKLTELNTVEEITRHVGQLELENLKARTDQLIAQATAEGNLVTTRINTGKSIIEVANRAYYAERAQQDLNSITEQATRSMRLEAQAAYNLEQAHRAQAAAAQLASFAEENLVSAIRSAAGAGLDKFDAQIGALQGAGASPRTKRLEAQIEKLQNAGSGGSGQNRQELANIAEERALILLRQRLRLMGTAIDLEKYSGKFLLEAINMKLKALQKQAAAQDRLNRLLDLQYKMSQKLRRNEGESISDFLARRAQENRSFLTEQRDIEQEAAEEKLQELKDKTEDEVALQELSERKKNSLSKGGSDNRIRNLQKELEASREADRKATAAKIAAIERQKKAYQQAYETAAEYATETKNIQIREAISAANTIEKLSQLSGQISGLAAAKSFLSALLTSGALDPQGVKDVTAAIVRINNTLGQYGAKRHNILTGHGVGKGPLEFAEGGIIRLTNASTPFGSNVRFGEQGDEYGVILQHKIAEGLKKSMGGGIGEQNFYLTRSDDWLKDRYEMKRLVKDAVSEALR